VTRRRRPPAELCVAHHSPSLELLLGVLRANAASLRELYAFGSAALSDDDVAELRAAAPLLRVLGVQTAAAEKAARVRLSNLKVFGGAAGAAVQAALLVTNPAAAAAAEATARVRMTNLTLFGGAAGAAAQAALLGTDPAAATAAETAARVRLSYLNRFGGAAGASL